MTKNHLGNTPKMDPAAEGVKEKAKGKGYKVIRLRDVCEMVKSVPSGNMSANRTAFGRMPNPARWKRALPFLVSGLQLFDVATAGFKQGQQSVRAAHVGGADHDEIGAAALQKAFDFGNPIVIANVEQPVREKRKIAIRRTQLASQELEHLPGATQPSCCSRPSPRRVRPG